MIDLYLKAPSRAALLADLAIASPWLLADGEPVTEGPGHLYDDERGHGIPVGEGFHANLTVWGKGHHHRAQAIVDAAAGGAMANGTTIETPATPARRRA